MSAPDASSPPAGAARRAEPRPRIGVSACLLGESVRWDGGHARDRFVVQELAPWAELVRVCPEAEAGFGVPRPAMRLVERDGATRLLVPATGADVTERLRAWIAPRLERLASEPLDGFVLKKDSPSCGLERVRVHGARGLEHKRGTGLFAAALQARFPGLPIEEDGRLNDPALRDAFVERVWCGYRWRLFRERDSTRAGLVRFHTVHKLLIRTHGEQGYARLGRLVASLGTRPDGEVQDDYGAELRRTLALPTTRGRHTNVLQHLFGFVKEHLSPAEKRHLLARIEDYRGGLVPLTVPLALLRFESERRAVGWASEQVYFEPHPKELRLRHRT